MPQTLEKKVKMPEISPDPVEPKVSKIEKLIASRIFRTIFLLLILLVLLLTRTI